MNYVLFFLGHFGLLAAHIVEVINAWPLLRSPYKALGKLLLVAAVLFLLGLLLTKRCECEACLARCLMCSTVSF